MNPAFLGENNQINNKMNANFIVKNGERETGEMSVFEAVEVAEKFKKISAEEDKIEIHSFCRFFAIKQNGKINQKIIFDSKEKAKQKMVDFVEVRRFEVWYRIHDGKDFIEYFTDTPNLADAVEEAIKEIRGAFAINYEGEIVSRHGENFILNPEKRR